MISFNSKYYDSFSLFHGYIPEIMGTRFDMLIVELSKEDASVLWNKIAAELIRMHKMMNRFDVNSELSRINKNAQNDYAMVSNEMWEILNHCKHLHSITEGLFDITLKNISEVSFNNNFQSVSFPSKDFYFDLGGYAKGYALDKIKKKLVDADVKHALVNFGDSSIAAMGHHPFGDCWSISIENPFQKGAILKEIKLKDQDLSSSGNMPTHPQHIINPFTKRYNSQKKVVCVCANSSLDAEVLTTTLMIASSEQEERIKSNFKIDKYIVFNL